MTWVQFHHPDCEQESSSSRSLSFPNCKVGFITPTSRRPMRSNDKAGEGQAGPEAPCRLRVMLGRDKGMSALLGGHPGQAGGVQVPALVGLPQPPLQPPEPRKGSVRKRALHLANAHLCFLLESITFFTSPGLFTQTSCSLTTPIAFSAILLTAQMSAVSLGVWWELSLGPTQPSFRGKKSRPCCRLGWGRGLAGGWLGSADKSSPRSPDPEWRQSPGPS